MQHVGVKQNLEPLQDFAQYLHLPFDCLTLPSLESFGNFCSSSSPLFASQYISVSVSQPYHALRDLHFHGCLVLQNFVRSCLIFLSVFFSHLAIAKEKQPKILCFLPVLLTAASQYISLSPGEHASISIAVWLLLSGALYRWPTDLVFYLSCCLLLVSIDFPKRMHDSILCLIKICLIL